MTPMTDLPARAARKFRWRVWSWLSSRPRICPANAHSLIISGYRRSPAIDSQCRDLANGSCWCGKLRDPDYKPEGNDR